MLVPVDINYKKQKDTKWICVCPSCQNERIISYSQKWNLETGKNSKICRSCQEESGQIVYNTKGLELGRKSNHNNGNPTSNKTTWYRNLFDAPGKRLEVKEKMRNAKLGKRSNNYIDGRSKISGYYYNKNKETIILKRKAYCKKIRAYLNAKEAARRAAKLKQTPIWLTYQQIKEIENIYKQAQELSNFGVPYEVDHIIPLQGKDVRGLHVPWNLQILTQSDNCKKSNKVI